MIDVLFVEPYLNLTTFLYPYTFSSFSNLNSISAFSFAICLCLLLGTLRLTDLEFLVIASTLLISSFLLLMIFLRSKGTTLLSLVE